MWQKPHVQTSSTPGDSDAAWRVVELAATAQGVSEPPLQPASAMSSPGLSLVFELLSPGYTDSPCLPLDTLLGVKLSESEDETLEETQWAGWSRRSEKLRCTHLEANLACSMVPILAHLVLKVGLNT